MTDVPPCDKVPPTPNGDRSLPFGLRCPLNPFQKAIQMKIRQLVPALLYGLLLAGPVFADARFEAETTREAEAVKLARDTQAGGYELLTAAELKKMIEEGKPMLLVDTMPYDASYRKEHIPGAQQFLFPVPRMSTWDTRETDGRTEADFAALLGADKARTLVFYCGFVKCTRSDNAAAWARKLGYTQVYRFPGGLFSWKGAGFPLEAVQ
jgi:thiosulfate/3-mercaptopyruvate sulfurtransferase